jgi:hypothetical protein
MPLRIIKADFEHVIDVKGTKITFRQLIHGEMLRLQIAMRSILEPARDDLYNEALTVLLQTIKSIEGYASQEIPEILRCTTLTDFFEIAGRIMTACNMDETQQKK